MGYALSLGGLNVDRSPVPLFSTALKTNRDTKISIDK